MPPSPVRSGHSTVSTLRNLPVIPIHGAGSMRKFILTSLISCLAFVLGMGLILFMEAAASVGLYYDRFNLARFDLEPQMRAYLESGDPEPAAQGATLFRADGAIMLVGELNVREKGHVVVLYDEEIGSIRYMALTPL